ncbi:MAG: glycosyltransferase family 87 protein, partial [bacterium]
VLANFSSGQNGLLAAALIAGALGFMERRPVLAGCFLGLLTFKPQLGILFPLILAVDGRWRMFFAAAVTVVFLFAASCLAFGIDTWIAFFHSLPDYSRVHLQEGEAYWMKMQSVFTLVRLLGGSATLAWIVHGTFIGSIALSLCMIWRSAASFDMKAAALALGSLLVSPYLFLYDFAVLAVPLAFLLHETRTTGFLPYELAGIAAACLLIFIFPLVMAPVGLAAAFIVLALILRRIASTGNAR